MNSDHIEITRQVLLNHVGVLADIVIEDALTEMHTKSHSDSVQWLREFILRVTKGLPASINRAGVIVELRLALMSPQPIAKD
jgi:hypothetical protein